ncbi:Ribonuclease P complex subunit Pop1, putative [Penicillium digitatum]|uniref:Ribonuclease P complex subunit Pop1, putative n=3 Tax=Penicillium digitatum TaxID=36651 RepID=K9GQ17_PEND2|nr:Ribonuclease P complex subunit Pop1, putative [Penicillium digitatum Pd1]EKV09981.1 Ribonuclease P complex subunit Pop1, putative [Penicillium digitatum Pd1]EKV15231.1 Ribonuclease P complex subunit Pop1, putative [Penicillium digitatum PHI26]QQK44387.1 Ribonuclease P complex subunit Pop1, putative [Penicillium digitatum]
MASHLLAKRKPFAPPGPHGPAGASRKRAKTFDARTLAVQSADAALSATGELDVAAYTAARAFEIQALEEGMQRSKNALTTRAFQKVPRSLRRRTASHNVKRVPRRLRARAKREMAEDNTPTVTARRRKPSQIMRIRLDTARRLQAINSKTKARRAAVKLKRDQENKSSLEKEGSHAFDIAPRVPKIKKNKLSRSIPAEPKYRKRQKCKTWLPTHLYHAKRAHMATTKDPIWRFAVPLSPTEKSYRPTHRARGARGAVAWDMSYMSTIQLEGTEPAIQAVLAAMGVNGENSWGTKGKKWRAGTRSLQAWTFEKDHPKRPTAPVTLIWCAKQEDVEMVDADEPQPKSSKKHHRKLWIRVHPSAFLQLWTDVLGVSKSQNPPVMVEDLRFEIGSIEITGPGSTEALLAVLKPSLGPDGSAPSAQSPEAVWPSLLGVSNPSSLPQNALLSFAISDPRLHFPPRTLHVPDNESHLSDLAILLSTWHPDKTQGPSKLFDRSTRLTAARQLPSQKSINRRRTLAGPGKSPLSHSSDPEIPIMVLANKPQSRAKGSNAPGSWTVLLPWKCVVPVWYSIMFYPLSSGGNPLLGGLKQQQQLAFEAGEAWFPGDFPGTRAGWEWGQREAEKSRRDWERRPKGRRPEFDNISLGDGRPKGEIGHGWACDWERLIKGPKHDDATTTATDGNSGKLPTESKEAEKNEFSTPIIPPFNLHNARLPPADTYQNLSKLDKTSVDVSTLATVYISLATRGTPTPRARIYRLPTDPALRQKWLDLGSARIDKSGQPKLPKDGNVTTKSEEARRLLARALISSGDGEPDSEPLDVPTEDDLIGFVTTGNYNLSEGKGTGIGSIQLSKVLAPNVKLSERRMCIIRASGEKSGRLGLWQFV